MEKPPESGPKKGSYESRLGKFETRDVPSLTGTDIELGDRVFIYTQSGNRYMIRRSKSKGGLALIYNESKGGFTAENGRLFRVRTETVAEVGKPLEYLEVDENDADDGTVATSTDVVRIEIRKGADDAAEAGGTKSRTGFGEAIAQVLKDEAHGRSKK